MSSEPLHLFERTGIELEYMLVDVESLDVRPEADELLRSVTGAYTADAERGAVTWSNELVLHVMEMKVSAPVVSLDGLSAAFAESVRDANDRLAARGARLMPAGAHPWMDPLRDARLWPHEGREIYAAFDGIFGCRTHGWTNLQSMHINLPFADDDEFGRLHAAIRLLLPLMPALAASTPFLNGRFCGLLDGRIDAYRTNAQRIPAVSGRVIPEPLFTAGDYRREILERLYREIEPYDAGGILRYEWLNARGAIARFERNTIEIRVLDMQECPVADLAVAWAVVHVLRALVEERWQPVSRQQAWGVEPLRALLLSAARDAEAARIDDADYAAAFGYRGPLPCTARDLWRHLAAEAVPRHADYTPVLELLLEEGSLARRLLAAAGREPDRATLAAVYRKLCDNLAANRPFVP